jgi:NAD(P)H-dependent FMN reductase
MKKIGIVISSTRPTRICKEIAEWVLENVKDTTELEFELIDLKEINLPFLDEPLKPALGTYEYEHTKAWSRLVSSFDGFIFVLPQYNWGYPAPLKNALDYLYNEWANKPGTIITYGSHGGGKAAEQLKVVLQGLHMTNTATNPSLSFTDEMLIEEKHFKDIGMDFEIYAADVKIAVTEMVELLSK